MKTEGKLCPLTKKLCYGVKCAFAVKGENKAITEKGNFAVTGIYYYCIVRDFMHTITLRE